jgi:uncharacterized membrane protein YheB (UPF0754 family)
MISTLYRKILKFKVRFKRANDTINIYDKKYRMDKYPEFPLIKIGLIVTGITVLGSVGSYMFFSKRVHSHIEVEGSKIAGKIANSDEVKKSLVAIMEDPEILETSTKLVSQLLKKLSENPETKAQIVTFLTDIINDEAIQNNLVTLSINFLNRPEIETKLSELVIALLSRQDVNDRINRLVEETCTHEPNREELSRMIKSVLSNPGTKQGLVNLVNAFVWGK